MKPILSIVISLTFTCIALVSSGATFRSGEKQTISSDINEDTYIAAGEISVNAVIGGDLVCAGGDIVINDTVEEDLIIAGGDLMVNGVINDDVRATGGTIDIMKSVGGDLIVFGGDIHIHESARIGGDVLIFGGSIDIDGDIEGELKMYGGEVQLDGAVNKGLSIKAGKVKINGEVRGNASIAGDEIKLGENSSFYNNVEYWQRDGTIDFGSALKNGAEANFNNALKSNHGKGFPGMIFGIGLVFIGLIYLVTILVLLIILQLLLRPVFINSSKYWKTDYIRTFGIGTLYIVATPVAAIVLISLVIGIPIGLFLLVNYGFTLFLSHLLAALIITNLIKEHYSPHWNNLIVILIAFVITIIIKFVSFIPIAGWLAAFVISAMALGSIILYGRARLLKKE